MPPTAALRTVSGYTIQRATVTVPLRPWFARLGKLMPPRRRQRRHCVTTVKSRKGHADDPKLHEFNLATARIRLLSAKVTRERHTYDIDLQVESRAINEYKRNATIEITIRIAKYR